MNKMNAGTFFSQIDTAVLNGEVASISQAFEILATCGLSFVDIPSHMLKKYDAEKLLKDIKENGVYVGSVFHPKRFEHTKEKLFEELKEDTKRELENCAKLECKIFMPVPIVTQEHKDDKARRECREKVAQYAAEVSSEAKKYGITTVLENFSDSKCPFSTIEDISYILNYSEDIYYALDTGNFWFGSTDVLKACDLFKNKIKHVHLKDILPKEDGILDICGRKCDSVEIGSGIIRIDTILDILRPVYSGGITIEINDERELIKKIKSSLTYLKSLDVLAKE